jgi:hypothetical protein
VGVSVKIHELKSWPQFFEAVISGEKTFEVRVNDRNFRIGDFLFLREYDPVTSQYSSRFQYARITYILGSDPALQHALDPNYVVLAISLYWWSTLVPVPPRQEQVSPDRPGKILPL